MLEIDIKNIHIGSLIHQSVKENEIEISYICNIFKCTENEIFDMYNAKSLNTTILLGWCDLLKFDFFRIYSQHLILYAPPTNMNPKTYVNKKTPIRYHKKNIYTKAVIDFMLEQLDNGNKTRAQIISEYRIPKTTVDRWIAKYKFPQNRMKEEKQSVI